MLVKDSLKQKNIVLKENSIIVPQTIKILIRVTSKHKKSKVKELIGILREYKNKYSSLSLQQKSKEWQTFD